MNLEQLRKRAKELARAARAGEPAAVERLGDLPPRLASAQLVLARELGYFSWPALVHEVAEQPFRTDLDYYEGRAYGIATVKGLSRADARRELAHRHGLSSWAELARRVQALASGEEPPTPFVLAYRAVEDGDLERLRALLDRHSELVRQRGTNGNDLFGMAGDLDVVRLLLERGADVNRGNDYGWTKLHQAGYGNDRELARAPARGRRPHRPLRARRRRHATRLPRSSGAIARSSTCSGSSRATCVSRPGSGSST